jgi:hypothetical protein
VVTSEVATAAAVAAAAADDDDDLLVSEWVQKIGCHVGHYDYVAYAVIDSDTVRTRHKQMKILSEK